jgi:hypothetical protein
MEDVILSCLICDLRLEATCSLLLLHKLLTCFLPKRHPHNQFLAVGSQLSMPILPNGPGPIVPVNIRDSSGKRIYSGAPCNLHSDSSSKRILSYWCSLGHPPLRSAPIVGFTAQLSGPQLTGWLVRCRFARMSQSLFHSHALTHEGVTWPRCSSIDAQRSAGDFPIIRLHSDLLTAAQRCGPYRQDGSWFVPVVGVVF